MTSLRRKLLVDLYLGRLAHALIKPVVYLLGKILRRPHDLQRPGDIAYLKLLGGGSIVIAYPSILALKSLPTTRRLILVATPATAPFGRILNVFDEIRIIRDDGWFHILFDSLRAALQLRRIHAIIDLEIHSRLSTLFCLLTLARNRIGAFTDDSFWRQNLSTHLLFYNKCNPVYEFYQQIAALFGAPPVPLQDAARAFQKTIAAAPAPAPDGAARWAIAPCCSELGRERMLSIPQWIAALPPILTAAPSAPVLTILAGTGDRPFTDAFATALREAFPALTIVNRAGALSLADAVRFLGSCQMLLAIDSSLLHFARLLGVPTESFWGPTDPAHRLAPLPLEHDRVHYTRLTCSPCVHIASVPPCQGNNICMQACIDPASVPDRNPIWLAQSPAKKSGAPA